MKPMKSIPGKDSSFSLIHHDPSALIIASDPGHPKGTHPVFKPGSGAEVTSLQPMNTMSKDILRMVPT